MDMVTLLLYSSIHQSSYLSFVSSSLFKCPHTIPPRTIALHTPASQLITSVVLGLGGLGHALAALLDHAAEDLEHDLGPRERRLLAGALVRGADLDDVGADEVEALDAAQDADQLARGPAAGLGGAGAGGKGRVEHVDVEAEVDGVLGAEGVHDGADDAGGAHVVHVVGADAHPVLRRVVVVVAVVVARQPRAQARVDVGLGRRVGQQALVAGQPEHGPVVEVRLLALPRRRVLGRVPCIEMGVKVQHPEVGIVRPQRSQGRQCQTVVTAQRDQLGLAVHLRDGRPRAELGKRGRHLLQGDGIVDRDHGDVAAVQNGGPVLIRVDAGARVESSKGRLPRAGMADRARTETGAFNIMSTRSNKDIDKTYQAYS